MLAQTGFFSNHPLRRFDKLHINYSLKASIAMSILTSSPTLGAYLPMPNSVRLMVVNAFAPIASFFAIGCGIAWKDVTVKVTGLVTPLRVKLPWISVGLSPLKTTLVDLILGIHNPTQGTVEISDQLPSVTISTWP